MHEERFSEYSTAASRGSAPASWPAGRPGGMTNPTASNSGFSALVGVAAAFKEIRGYQ